MPGTPGGLGGTPPTPALGSFEMGISGSYASPALGWCRDYVRVASGDYNGQRASSESDALESLLTVLSHAIGVMQAREHGTATAEQVNLAQINSCVSGALEAVPGLKASMQGVGWQGTRFANSLSSALLQRAHEVTRAYLIDISDSGQANRLRLCQTHFFDWCVSTFHAWTQAGDSNPFQEVSRVGVGQGRGRGPALGWGKALPLVLVFCRRAALRAISSHVLCHVARPGGGAGVDARAGNAGAGGRPCAGFDAAVHAQAQRARVSQAL